jgi:hypothetical protein
MSGATPLTEYQRKRDFGRTPELLGSDKQPAHEAVFVV